MHQRPKITFFGCDRDLSQKWHPSDALSLQAGILGALHLLDAKHILWMLSHPYASIRCIAPLRPRTTQMPPVFWRQGVIWPKCPRFFRRHGSCIRIRASSRRGCPCLSRLLCALDDIHRMPPGASTGCMSPLRWDLRGYRVRRCRALLCLSEPGALRCGGHCVVCFRVAVYPAFNDFSFALIPVPRWSAAPGYPHAPRIVSRPGFLGVLGVFTPSHYVEPMQSFYIQFQFCFSTA